MALVLASVLEENSSCIDIGAAYGDVLAELLRLAPHGRHIAYEPLPSLAAQLRSRFPTVDVRTAAVSDSAGQLGFVHVLNDVGFSGLRHYDQMPGDTEEISVKVVRLDDDLPSEFIPTLIKVDVNGAEVELFRGAARTLSTYRPYVLFEHGQAALQYQHTTDDVYDILVEECGLRVFDLDGNGPLTRSGFAEAVRSGAKWNFLARP